MKDEELSRLQKVATELVKKFTEVLDALTNLFKAITKLFVTIAWEINEARKNFPHRESAAYLKWAKKFDKEMEGFKYEPIRIPIEDEVDIPAYIRRGRTKTWPHDTSTPEGMKKFLIEDSQRKMVDLISSPYLFSRWQVWEADSGEILLRDAFSLSVLNENMTYIAGFENPEDAEKFVREKQLSKEATKNDDDE